MDLFERRVMTKKVHVDAKYIQHNIQTSLLAKLKTEFQGRCLNEGYVQRDSFTIVSYSLGRCNYLRGGVDYDVTFQADVCLPHPGQTFRGKVRLVSKLGLDVEVAPLKVLIPRDLHMGHEQFDTAKPGDEVEFQVIQSQFRYGDEDIIVLGKLSQTQTQAPELPTEPPPALSAPSGDTMHVVVAPPKRKLTRPKTTEA
jgi:DNA-directed RNA polymerase subunit E'/Rpb7